MGNSNHIINMAGLINIGLRIVNDNMALQQLMIINMVGLRIANDRECGRP